MSGIDRLIKVGWLSCPDTGLTERLDGTVYKIGQARLM